MLFLVILRHGLEIVWRNFGEIFAMHWQVLNEASPKGSIGRAILVLSICMALESAMESAMESVLCLLGIILFRRGKWKEKVV